MNETINALIADRDDLRARLTTAEQERVKALVQLHYVPDEWRYTGRLRAAEARVEALSEALRRCEAV